MRLRKERQRPDTAVMLFQTVNRHHIRVIETGHGFRLAHETLPGSRRVPEVGRKEFRRDLTVKHRVGGEKHCPHPAFADFGGDAIIPMVSLIIGER